MKDRDILCGHLSKMDGIAVSFSGGVDSTVVLAAAMRALPDDHVAVFADVPMLSERQRRITMNVANELGANAVSVKLEWDDLPGIRDNTEERCYICKRGIYSAVRRIADDNGYVCVDGENSSDRSEDRPGRRAAGEFGIISPLKELGFSRDAVRRMFSELRLTTDVQKETCMATRIPFGVPFGDADIRFIGECEELIREIAGVRQIRMRLRDGRAHLLTSPDSVRSLMEKEEELSSMLLKRGITAVVIDADGYKE